MANKTKYTEQLFDQICQELAEGQSIREVLNTKERPERPTWECFRQWINKYPERREKYTQAKQDGCEYLLANAEEYINKSISKSQNETAKFIHNVAHTTYKLTNLLLLITQNYH
jgi:hypothetical protein